MKQVPLSLRIAGCPASGRRTIAGCLLYKFNGVSLLDLERLTASGIDDYGRIVESLLSLGTPLRFETPSHLVSIIESDLESITPDIWLVIVSPEDELAELADSLQLPPTAKVIVLISKMDLSNWSEDVFQLKVDQVSTILPNATYIPCSGLDGDNFITLSSNSPWYAKRFESPHGRYPEQGTLLATIDSISDRR